MTSKKEWLLCLGVFLLALLPRVTGLNAFATWDEANWASRSVVFIRALQGKDFAGTLLVGHPGVTTMWAGGAGMAIQSWLRPDISEDLALIGKGGDKAKKKLPIFLPAAKLPIALITATSVMGIYLLVKALFNRRIAFLCVILIAIDPFYLAHSRVLHLDALTSTFMTLSLLSLLLYLTHHRCLGYLFFSGSMAGLAFLSKSPSFFLIPFAGLLLAVTCYIRPLDLRKVASRLVIPFALWGSVAALFFVIFWPAMWVNPVGTLRQVLASAKGYAVTPHENLNFFLGQVRPDPGPWLYPVALLFRMTPLTTLGAMASIPVLLKGEQEGKMVLRSLLVYILLFGIFMTMGAKKFDRYLLPIFPSVDIVASVGLWGLVKTVRFNRKSVVALALALALQAGHVLSYHPYYLSYYNPLAGGAGQAVKTVLVGWGEGMEQAARYLNQKEGARELKVATKAGPSFVPYFIGHQVDAVCYNSADVDYVVQYVSARQRRITDRIIEIYGDREPEHIIRIHGIEYARIYRNDHYVDVMDYLRERTQPEDAIIINTPSLFARYYQGNLPIYAISTDPAQGEAEVASALNRVARRHRRVWYVHYEVPGDLEGLILHQLETYAVPLEDHSFSPFEVTVTCYFLPLDIFFAPAPLYPLTGPSFGEELKLVGYRFSRCSVRSGWHLGVFLQWQALRAIERDYSVSLRLVDEREHLWGQKDKTLQNNSLHFTSKWKEGELDRELYFLPAAPGTPPGKYLIKILLYHWDTGERLNILGPKGAPLGTEYTLGSIQVTRPTSPPEFEELHIQYPLSRDLGDVKLLGYNLGQSMFKPGETLHLTLFWQALSATDDDYELLLQVRDQDGHVRAEGKFPPNGREYPTSSWERGDIVGGQYDLTIDAAATVGEHKLMLNLVNQDTGRALFDRGFPLASLQVVGRTRRFAVPKAIGHPMQVNLGDCVTFLGYNLVETQVAPGGTLHLSLYWQAQQKMATSYTVFTHLLNSENRIWGQKDNVPIQGTYPTTGWLPGEVIVDEYEIPIKSDAPSGEYVLEIGMYDAATGDRLPVFDERGERMPDDRILLHRIRVER